MGIISYYFVPFSVGSLLVAFNKIDIFSVEEPLIMLS